MKNESVDATRETGEGHPGISTANEKARHIALRVEHVGHDMGERTTTTSTNKETSREGTESKREEQTESVIETEHIGEELPAQCTRSDEEAGSIVLHVSSDMNEKEKMMKRRTRQQQQKRLRRFQRKTWKSEDSSRRVETHPKKRSNV